MRKKTTLWVLGIIGSVVLASFIYLYMAINRPASKELSMVENVERIDSYDLINFFKTDQSKANASLVEKVIEVEGVVENISYLNNRHTILLKSESFSQSFVMCDMSPMGKQQITKITKGDTIALRGVCKGYLLDVIMLNCIPIDEKSKK